MSENPGEPARSATMGPLGPAPFSPGDLALALTWCAGMGLGLQVVRQTAILLRLPVCLAFLCVLIVVQVLVAQGSLALFDHLTRRGWSIVRLLWLITLGPTALLGATLMLLLWLPHGVGVFATPRQFAGLPPLPYTRFVTAAFAAIACQFLYVFARASARFWVAFETLRPGPDRLTSRLVILGALLLAVAIPTWPLLFPANYLYAIAWHELTVSHRPLDALGTFQDLATHFPQSDLADAAMYRSARIYQVHLGQPDRAAAAFEELISRYPASTLAPDALLEEARCTIASDPQRALALSARLLASYPTSFHAPEAYLMAADALSLSGHRSDAKRMLDLAQAIRGARRIVRDPDDDQIEVIGLAQAVADARTRLGL